MTAASHLFGSFGSGRSVLEESDAAHSILHVMGLPARGGPDRSVGSPVKPMLFIG